MIDLLAGPLDEFAAPGRVHGVVVGVVTNNDDKDGLGRVKVKFPWLSLDDESNWARVVTPMAGDGMGIYFLPEVEDEVLVAFEHGRVDRPLVLGALWNGKQKPPQTNSDGKNGVRVMQSRSGHTITLDDTSGSEKITVADGQGQGKVIIDGAGKCISITSGGDLAIKAQGAITIESASGDVTVQGTNLTVKAQAGLTLSGVPVDVNSGALKVQ